MLSILSFYQTDHSTLWWMVEKLVNIVSVVPQGCVFGLVIVPFDSENKMLKAVLPSPSAVAESLIRDHGMVSESCDR